MPAIPRQRGNLVASTPSPLKRLPQELAGLLLELAGLLQELVRLPQELALLPRLPVRLSHRWRLCVGAGYAGDPAAAGQLYR